MSTNNFSPLDANELNFVGWNASDAVRRLAELIANAAVSGDGEIPIELLESFHLAKQLKEAISRLEKTNTAALMTEAMS